MSRFFIKIAKIGLWVFVPMILISGTELNYKTLEENRLFYGEYVLQVNGDLNEDLVGIINFETITKNTDNGVRFSAIKLILDNDNQNLNHSMQFIIANENLSGQISDGLYLVSTDFDGFLNYFDGVFGFANIETLGELPFFTKKGNIQIKYLGNNILSGTLQVRLKNANDELINLSGDFVATKKVKD